MRIIISLLHQFKQTPDGNIYPYSVFDYDFWKHYLEVFDGVKVFARVDKVEKIDSEKATKKANGPGVEFVSLPHWRGAKEYLLKYPQIKKKITEVLDGEDAVILRIPGYLSTMLWRQMKKGRPYATEAVGDPWQVLSPGSYPSILRPIYRRLFTWEMKQQCKHAVCASYVTQKELQKRYPPGGWNTYYSSIDLPKEVIVNDDIVEQRIKRVDQKAKSHGPWKLCFVGSMWHLAKSPDVLIQAVADCIKKGFNIELKMIGDGSLMPELEKMAETFGIKEKVEFTGHLPPGDAIYHHLDESDIFILPSRSEGLPRSVIEAFARGLPAIGGHQGGFPELLAEKYMVPKIDVENMSGTIINVISDVDGMKNIIKKNISKAREYQADVLQQRRNEMYKKLKEITGQWFKSK